MYIRIILAILISNLVFMNEIYAREILIGTGKLVSIKQDISKFNQITISGIGVLHMKPGEKEELTIEAEDNIMPMIETKVESGHLYLGLKNNIAISVNKGIQYYLTITDIKAIKLNGAANLEINEKIKLEELKLVLNGVGNANILIDVKNFISNIAGYSKLKAKGYAKNQTINIRGSVYGSGNVNAAELLGKNATVNIYGSGSAAMNVADNLDINILGTGNVSYLGNPKMTQKTSEYDRILKIKMEPILNKMME